MREDWPCTLCEGRAAGHYVLVDDHGTDTGAVCAVCTNRLEERERAAERGRCLSRSDCENEPVYSVVNYNRYAPDRILIDTITRPVLCEACHPGT